MEILSLINLIHERQVLRCVLVFLSLFIVTTQAQPVAEPIIVSPDIELFRLDGSFYIHTSWYEFPGFGRAPSNGLLLVKDDKALLIDTPNTNEQTAELHHFVRDSLHAEIKTVIVGHSHSDCVGGLQYLHDQGVQSVSGEKTKKICLAKNLPIPTVSFVDSLEFDFAGERIICRYFGGGHTIDNIVVYVPDSKILFGGCLIKSKSAGGLGYTGEAMLDEWEETLDKVRQAFPDARVVIPGHGAYGGSELLDHTAELVREFRKANP